MFKHEGFHGKRMELNHGPKTAPIHPLLWHNMGIQPRTMGIRWGPEWDIVEWEKSETPRSPLLSQCKQKYIIVLYTQYIYILYSLLCMVIITLVSYGSKHFIRIYLDPQRLILLVVHGAKKELCCTVFFTPPCRTQSRFPFTKFGVQQFIPSLLGSDHNFLGAAIMIMPVYRDGTKPPIPYFRGC